MESQIATHVFPEQHPTAYDAIIVGAGMSGMYQLIRLRELGLSVRVFEAGSDVGGTWYWNRYPGARFDSESYTYGYSFSNELLQEWSWSEHFASQPETLRYLNHVAEKFELRKDITFNCRVIKAIFDPVQSLWLVSLGDGTEVRARYFITAVGVLSAPVTPQFTGAEDFRGTLLHTGLWPHTDGPTFAGKKVAVIGTGASGVQVIQEVAKSATHLTVFQRSPNWCAPLQNRSITASEQEEIKTNYARIFAKCAKSLGAFLHAPDKRSAIEVSQEEREAFYEALYAAPGFGIWLGNYKDILIDQQANDTISEFVANKIRSRVFNQEIAEKLIPKDHGFGTRRVPLETKYYEVYNQSNVELVDLKIEPIERITVSGIQTKERQRDFDIIIYATGFDAILGSLNRIEIRGVDGIPLVEKWLNGPKTFLGIFVHGFPNMFTLIGPHNAGTVCNLPRCIEQNVEWVTRLLAYMNASGRSRVEVLPEFEANWTRHVNEMAEMTLLGKTDSWFMGINKNIEGRDRRMPLIYVGGTVAYRQACELEADNGYPALEFQ